MVVLMCDVSVVLLIVVGVDLVVCMILGSSCFGRLLVWLIFFVICLMVFNRILCVFFEFVFIVSFNFVWLEMMLCLKFE